MTITKDTLKAFYERKQKIGTVMVEMAMLYMKQLVKSNLSIEKQINLTERYTKLLEAGQAMLSDALEWLDRHNGNFNIFDEMEKSFDQARKQKGLSDPIVGG